MSLEKADKDELAYMAAVKSLPCGVCSDPPPSYAHHMKEGDRRIGHYSTIPLCFECHQGKSGIHGDKALWRVFKKTELKVLDETKEKLWKLNKR